MSSHYEKLSESITPIITSIWTPMSMSSSSQSGSSWSWSRIRPFLLPAIFIVGCFSLLVTFSTSDSALFGEKKGPHREWLIATMTPYYSISRREIIRSTWQNLYRNQSHADFKFVLSKPDPVWEPVLERENKTYGDLIILRNIEETLEVSHHTKSVDFLTYLVDQNDKYTFVSKLEDDSYLDGATFFSKYLKPLMLNGTAKHENGVPAVNDIVIGRPLKTTGKDYIYPGSQFYTLSWNIVETLVSQQRHFKYTDLLDDVLVGELLDRADIEYKFIELPTTEAFEMKWDGTVEVNGKKTAWAYEGTKMDTEYHPVGFKSINPHKMREDDQYLKVAACFGPKGPRRPEPTSSTNELSRGQDKEEEEETEAWSR